MTIFSVFLIETAIIIAFVLLTVIVFKVSNKKKTVDPKKTTVQKDVKKTSVYQKVNFLTDWKTWIMLVFGYILFGIGQELPIFSGFSASGLSMLSSGKLYLPLTGIFYSLILGMFFYLLTCLKSPIVCVFGFIFEIFFAVVSIWNFWFIPYNQAHLVPLPILHYVGLNGFYFPADPIVSWWLVALGVIILYLFVGSISGKDNFYSKVPGNMVLITAVTIFLPQLWHLSSTFDLMCFIGLIFLALRVI